MTDQLREEVQERVDAPVSVAAVLVAEGSLPTHVERTLTRRTAPGWAVAVIVLVAGLGLTGLLAWSASSQGKRTQSKLLAVQTRQAAEVVVAAIPATQAPLQTSAQLAATTGSAAASSHYLSGYLSGPTPFRTAEVWRLHGARVSVLATLGVPTHFSRAARALVARRATRSSTFVVVPHFDASPPSIGYATARRGPSGSYVVYAVRALAANRHARVQRNSAFDDLYSAIYVGRVSPSNLVASDFPDSLPSGVTKQVTIPFGDTTITLVTAADGPLGGTLSDRLPWLLLIGGIVLSVAAAALTLRLANQRREMATASTDVLTLHRDLEHAYDEQRTIALTLQRSLLPLQIPRIPGLETAVRYIPGVEGAEVGGDWYSIVPIGDGRRFAFVVGDVSGHGVRSAAVMAALRFTVRTLLLEGRRPDEALVRCASQTRELVRGHLATVLVGVGDLASGTVTLASAGHLPPLQLRDGHASFLPMSVGVPLGAPGTGYETTTLPTPPGSTLLLFTDGLIERRGEPIDDGLDRLARAVETAPAGLEELVTDVCHKLTDEGGDDDVAMLAMRWVARDV
jgi:serine phosphatase RsbU (regulator of sigma subunit)